MVIDGMVSIIMPAYNAESFISEAIQSVVTQSYRNWQLIIINDGSTDRTEEIISRFVDARIVYVRTTNNGVSAARNAGLEKSVGQFICFLDSDDVLTPTSLEERVNIFRMRPDVDFVDGSVIVTKREIQDVVRIWTPSFQGPPFSELVALRDTCFVTISWMIRERAIRQTRFRVGLSHCEDLLFLIDAAYGRTYTYTTKPVLYFRRTGESAMANLEGLGNGYFDMYDAITKKKFGISFAQRVLLKWKISKIMFLSFAAQKRPFRGFSFVICNIFR